MILMNLMKNKSKLRIKMGYFLRKSKFIRANSFSKAKKAIISQMEAIDINV